MIALYSYPELFGVADNNGNGLKVFAFLRFTGVLFTQEHIFDARPTLAVNGIASPLDGKEGEL